MKTKMNWAEPTSQLPPLNVDGERPFFSIKRETQLIWLFLLLGLVARSVRYFLRFPLWDDECFLCFNFIDKDYQALAGPLEFHQVAPILFLWCERAMTQLFGYNEMALRLIPYLCSVASLFLFRYLASQMMRGSALILSTAVFAVAYPGIRYAAEAKPYGTDLFVGIALLSLAVSWWKNPLRMRYLIGLILFTPLAVGYSYPSVFVAGGVSLAILFVLSKQGTTKGWGGWLLYNVVLLSSFIAVFIAAKSQAGAEQSFMDSYWLAAFPPWREPLHLPLWFLQAHTSDLMAYPVGGAKGASLLTFISFTLGTIYAYRQRRPFLLLLCFVPLSLNLVAAAMHRYPYGGHVKFAQYIAPMLCMMSGLGGAVFFNWLKPKIAQPQKGVASWLIILSLIGFGSIARDFAFPQKTSSDRRFRDFARSYWLNMEHEGEAACLYFDFDQRFSKEMYSELNWVAMYHCNQHIYSPRHINNKPIDWNKISEKHPLRCVLYQTSITKHQDPDAKRVDPQTQEMRLYFDDFDQLALEKWLEQMQQKYHLVYRDRTPFPVFSKRGVLGSVDYIEVFKFVPKQSNASNRK